MFSDTGSSTPAGGRHPRKKTSGFYDATIDRWLDRSRAKPYVQSTQDPHGRFRMVAWRACSAGGPITGGRISLRNGPYDFKPHRRDGLGFDWPISYDDVAPYYDKVERLIGVYGTSEGAGEYAEFPGRLSAAARRRPLSAITWFSNEPGASGFPSFRAHRAVLTRQLDFKRSPALFASRQP